MRAQILAQREMEYVTAAKAMGREHTIVFRHILPNVVSLLIVLATLDLPCMLTESTLSYLGFGIPLDPAGQTLNGANNSIVIQQYWWQWVFPAVIFGICTILHQPDRRRPARRAGPEGARTIRRRGRIYGTA